MKSALKMAGIAAAAAVLLPNTPAQAAPEAASAAGYGCTSKLSNTASGSQQTGRYYLSCSAGFWAHGSASLTRSGRPVASRQFDIVDGGPVSGALSATDPAGSQRWQLTVTYKTIQWGVSHTRTVSHSWLG